MSGFDIPCVKPPWGTLAAVDMSRGEIAWQVPLGDAPFVRTNVGMPNLGGPIATASGLVFIAASFDDRFRAFDIDNGEQLWEVKLPAGGQATPMTYAIDGRQFIVIAAATRAIRRGVATSWRIPARVRTTIQRAIGAHRHGTRRGHPPRAGGQDHICMA